MSARIGYLDMFSGVSGDMLLGACLDAGVEIEDLCAVVDALDLPGVRIETRLVERHGLRATRCVVEVPEDGPERSLGAIEAVIREAALSEIVAERSIAVFRRLARAEAKVHGVTIDEVHFHEVGALDAIVDVVGAVWCLEALEIEELRASPFRLGTGWVDTAHGRLPVPPPAVSELVRGWPVAHSTVEAELTTPTGAALVTTLATGGGAPSEFIPLRVGYGAGQRAFETHPNLLRLIIGEVDIASSSLRMLECDLDDLDPRLYGPLSEALYERGAVEVHWIPIQMKKQRPGVTIRALTPEPSVDAVVDALFEQTTTLGVRMWRVDRRVLRREEIEMETSWGPVMVKRVRRRDGRLELRPEFEACRRIAEERGLPVRDVLTAISAELRLEPGPDEAV